MPDKTRRRQRSMFMLFFFAIILVAAYAAYYFVAVNQVKKGVASWIASEAAKGNDIAYDDMVVSGFPMRFHIDVHNATVKTQDQKAWSFEKLMIVSQPYNPTHIIAYAPGEIRYEDLSGVTYSAPGDPLQASLRWSASGLKRLSIVADELVVQRDEQPWMALKLPFLHAAPLPEDTNDLQVISGFDDMTIATPPEGLDWLGEHAGRMRAAVRVAEGNTLLKQGVSPDGIRQLDVQLISPESQLSWGPLEVRMRTERLVLDDSNRLQGVVETRVENIDAIASALQSEGMMTDDARFIIAALRGLMADEAWLPVVLKNGRASVASMEFMDISPLF